MNSLDVPAPASSFTFNLTTLFNYEPQLSNSGGFDDNQTAASLATGTSDATQMLRKIAPDTVQTVGDSDIHTVITAGSTSASSELSTSIGSSTTSASGDEARDQRVAVTPSHEK